MIPAGRARSLPSRSRRAHRTAGVEALGGGSTGCEHPRTTFILAQHLRMTGSCCAIPIPSPRTRACASSSAAPAGVRRKPRARGPAPLRDRRAVARLEARVEAFFDARLGLEPLDARFTVAHLRSLTRGRHPHQGAAARSAADRRRGQHLRRRGSVPRPHPPAAPGRAPVQRAVRRTCARGWWTPCGRASTHAARAIDDFRHPDGVARLLPGPASSSTFARVSPACVCGGPIVKLVVAGRGTYEGCQPRPRLRRRLQRAVRPGRPA